jgi:hypothetical protein
MMKPSGEKYGIRSESTDDKMIDVGRCERKGVMRDGEGLGYRKR